MAKTKISEFSPTAGNNTDIDGINLAEGCAPSGINDAIRELMAQLKDFQAGTAGDSFNGPVGTTTAAAGAFTTLSASSTVSGTGFSTYLASPPAIGGTAAAAGSFTTLSASSTVSGTGFSTYLASPPAIGGTTAAAGSFTTLSASSTVTLSGGTANGVGYLNASKVFTTGSALTFDGSTLGTTGGINAGNNVVVTGGSIQARNGIYTYFWNSDTTNYVTLQNPGATGAGNAQLAFGISGVGEAMRLTSTGLGIGTSSPSAQLNVVGTGDMSGIFESTGTSNAASVIVRSGNGTTSGLYAYARFVNNDSNAQDWRIGTYGTNNLSIVNAKAGTTPVVLDTSGNLGLGVTPSAWSGFTALQVGNTAVWSTSTNNTHFSSNLYYNGTDRIYIGSNFATEYAQQSGAHKWFTAASGTAGNAISFTQSMTLDASGNLGVGITSPSSRITVKGPAGSNPNTNGIVFQYSTSTNNFGALGLDNSSGDFVMASGSGCAIRFYTNSDLATTNERARITSGGYFKASDTGGYIGSTGTYHEFTNSANSNGLYIYASNNTTYSSSVIAIAGNRTTTNASYNLINAYNGDVSGQFIVRDSGNAINTNGSYGTISDAKMKTDIVDAGSQWADIKAVRFRKFKMKNDPAGLAQLGVVAQELEQTSPGLVDEHPDRDAEGNDLGTTTKSVKTSVLLMKAAVALQEAMDRIEKLEARVALLEGK